MKCYAKTNNGVILVVVKLCSEKATEKNIFKLHLESHLDYKMFVSSSLSIFIILILTLFLSVKL